MVTPSKHQISPGGIGKQIPRGELEHQHAPYHPEALLSSKQISKMSMNH